VTSAQNPQTPQNPQQQQFGHQPDLKHSVVVNIDQYLKDGMPVFDANGDKVGTVKLFSMAAGYLMVGQGSLTHQDLYLPFRLPPHRPAGDRALRAHGHVLVARYAEPPAIHTIVENRFAPPGPLGLGRGTMPQAYELREVQSGYDSALNPVDRVEPASIAKRLSVVPAVSDADGVRMGDLSQYDTARGLLTEEKGLFTPTVLLVPFSAIRSVDRDELSVSLTPPRATLVQDQATLRSNS